MSCILTMKRPESAEELRQAIYHLLNDQFERHAMIDRQRDNFIEYRDMDAGEEGLEADILIVDSYRHTRAQDSWDRWADDAPSDDYQTAKANEAAEAAKADPLRVDVMLANAMNEDEKHVLQYLRSLVSRGWTSGQIVRSMLGNSKADDPEIPAGVAIDPKAINDRMPALLRLVRSRLTDFLGSDLDKRVLSVESKALGEGASEIRVDFKAAKRGGQPDSVFVTIQPGF